MKRAFIQYGVGIDVSKRHLHVNFQAKTADETIKVRASRKFDNTPGGMAQLAKWIEQHRKDKALVLRIYLEVTGVYHEEVLSYLHEQGYWVSLLMGKRVKAYGKSIGQDSKNDPGDSYVLAHMALNHKQDAWQPVSAHIMQIRSLMRHRKALINSKVAFGNQSHALKHSIHPKEQVQTSLELMIRTLDEQIELIEQQALALAKADTELYEKISRIVDSLKGMGLISMLIIISETNGFTTFKSIDQLIKYAGYDIIENQSGNSTGKTRISKHGNARLRSALYMPTLSIIRQKVEPFFGLYIRVLKRNPGIKKKAQVAVQRKLLILIYTLWKKNEAFDPEYYLKANTSNSYSPENGSSSSHQPELHGIEIQKTSS